MIPELSRTSKREPPIIKPRLLTVREAAIYLGRSIPSIRELVWSGSLPVVRVGRRIHFDILDLNRWIEENKVRYTN